jgi:hypothetical protein
MTKLEKYQISVVFSISQHVRDIYLFEIIKNYLDCGVIEQAATRLDSMTIVVYNFNDILNKILPFFDNNPLLSMKRLDYLDFCKVAYMIKDKKHLTEEGINNIKKIISNMNRGRQLI